MTKLAMLPEVSEDRPTLWAPLLDAAFAKYEINTLQRQAMFIANTVVETGKYRFLVEDMDYRAARIAVVWPSRFQTPMDAEPYAHNPEKLANKVYGYRLGNVEPGDGWKFRGRGLIQITGRTNYQRFANVIGASVDALVDILATPEGAVESACHFWKMRGCNAMADTGNFQAVRVMVNGGTNGLYEAQKVYKLLV